LEEKHFLELLEGEKETGEETKEKRRMETKRRSWEKGKEIEIQLKKIKKKKATGVDGIGCMEKLYSNGCIRERLKDLLQRIWKEEGFLEK